MFELRRWFVATRVAVWVLALLVVPAWLAAQNGKTNAVHAVASVGFTVGDMERSIAFFTDVLTFRLVSDTEVAGDAYERLQGVFPARLRVARMALGSEIIELTEYIAPKGRPIPAETKSNDRSFQHIAIVVSDIQRAYDWLRQHRVTHISSGPQRLPDWNPNAGGISAFYFRDPDGHPLEIIHFPPGKGDPRWQREVSNQIFLGIDHTAIVVADTETSLAFYQNVLGFRVAGASENYGIEQERLNAVFGARLRITALRTDDGPGIEFLEYLSPRDGRPMPTDGRANDLIHWQTALVTSDAEALAARVRAARGTFISPDVVVLPDATLGFRKGVLVRDPDGHVMAVIER